MKVRSGILLKNNISSYKMPKTQNKDQKSPKHDSLSPSYSKISLSKNQENTFKDSLEGSISESKTNLLIPDSLNNTKSSLAITGLLKNKKSSKNMRTENNIICRDTKITSPLVLTKEKSVPENINKKQIENNNIKSESNEEDTKKIDYRYYTNYPFKDISGKRLECEEKLYWFAAYDKLIKKKKIVKILNYYSEMSTNINNINYITDESIKEQLLIIKDFDIYFEKQSNIPLIKKVNDGYIFVKLYLLTLEQINQILNYVNRFKFTLSYNIIKNLQEKGSYQILFNNYRNFPFNIIYHMGSFMNTNIYAFSKLNNNNNNISKKYLNIPDYLNQKFPNSRCIAKLVKLLLIHFPKYTSDFFICYLLSKIKFENFNEKSNEIKTIIYSKSNIQTQNFDSNNENHCNNTLIQTSFSPFSLLSNTLKKEDYSHTQKKLNIPFSESKSKKNNDSLQKKTKKLENGLKKVKEENETKNNSYTQHKSVNNKTIEKNITFKNNNIFIKKKNISTIISNNSVNKKNWDKERGTFNAKNKTYYKSSVISSNKEICEKKVKFAQPTEKKIDNKKTFKKLGKISLVEFEKKVIKQISQEKPQNKNKNKNNKRYNTKNNISITNNNIMTSKTIYNIISDNNDNSKINNNNKINNKKRKEEKKEKLGIYVVSRRIKTEIQDDIDDSSILMNKNRTLIERNNSRGSVYITPQKKRKYKYYS